MTRAEALLDRILLTRFRGRFPIATPGRSKRHRDDVRVGAIKLVVLGTPGTTITLAHDLPLVTSFTPTPAHPGCRQPNANVDIRFLAGPTANPRDIADPEQPGEEVKVRCCRARITHSCAARLYRGNVRQPCRTAVRDRNSGHGR
jgi:hypothetical protein